MANELVSKNPGILIKTSIPEGTPEDIESLIKEAMEKLPEAVGEFPVLYHNPRCFVTQHLIESRKVKYSGRHPKLIRKLLGKSGIPICDLKNRELIPKDYKFTGYEIERGSANVKDVCSLLNYAEVYLSPTKFNIGAVFNIQRFVLLDNGLVLDIKAMQWLGEHGDADMQSCRSLGSLTNDVLFRNSLVYVLQHGKDLSKVKIEFQDGNFIQFYKKRDDFTDLVLQYDRTKALEAPK